MSSPESENLFPRPPLELESHARYLLGGLKMRLPGDQCAAYDTTRVTLAFFAVAGLDLMARGGGIDAEK